MSRYMVLTKNESEIFDDVDEVKFEITRLIQNNDCGMNTVMVFKEINFSYNQEIIEGEENV